MPVIAQAPSGLRLVRSNAPLSRGRSRQQVVRDRGRLRALRVRVHGQNGFGIPIGEVQQRLAQLEGGGHEAQNELALPHPVHRHVDVVAAAGGVQAAGDVFAAGCDDQTLDVEEQILAGAVVFRAADVVL